MRLAAPRCRGLLLAALLVGCSGSADTGADGDDGEFSQDNPDAPDARFAVTWGEEALLITVEGGEDGQFWFGAADLTLNDSWTGEDCFEGDRVGINIVRYCHPLAGASTELAFGGSASDLAVGAETALDDSRSGRVVYYFFEVLSETCWIGGAQSNYYDDICDNVGVVVVQ